MDFIVCGVAAASLRSPVVGTVERGGKVDVVEERRARCRDALAMPEGASLDDIWTLSRFLKARNGDLDDAEEMLYNNIEFKIRII